MEQSFTVGVEEEYFIVDAETRELRPRAETVLEAARRELGDRVEPELNLAQIEVSTPVCTSLEDVSAQLCRLRERLMAAARTIDSHIVAIGTHPFSDWMGQQTTPKDRYRELDDTYQQLAWEQLVCGCHVHVAVDDPELAIKVMNRLRPWLPTLRALATNSPFWQGVDTGYASHRMSLFDRWPTAGPPPVLRDRAHYDDIIASLVETGSMSDATKLYWDVRPSTRYPTLEFRVADVCMTVDEAVMIAGLARALVRTSVRDVVEGRPLPTTSQDLLRVARWRAARHGVDADLVDARHRRSQPARLVIANLLAHVRPALEEHGEWQRVAATVEWVLALGPGSTRQRARLTTGDFRAVVDAAVDETTRAVSQVPS